MCSNAEMPDVWNICLSARHNEQNYLATGGSTVIRWLINITIVQTIALYLAELNFHADN